MTMPSTFVLDAYQSNKDMANYLFFDDIPDSRQDEASLIGWLYHCGTLAAIPKYLWTERVLEGAVYWDQEALASIRRADTPNFQYRVDLALSANSNRTKYIRSKDYTEDFLIKISCAHPRCMFEINWSGGLYDLLTDKAIVQIGSASIVGMINLINYRSVNDDLITNEVVKSAIKNQPDKINELAEYDRYLPVIVEAVDDYWPTFTPMNLSFFERRNLDASVRPTSLKNALDCFAVSPDRDINVFFKVCVKKYPIDEVIETALGMPGGLNKLFDLYASDELQPHTKNYRQLRGRFLEDALGM